MSSRTSSISCPYRDTCERCGSSISIRPIGGTIEGRCRLPPRRSKHLVIAEDAPPGGTRMRRFDQRIGKIAKLSFVVGELKLRGPQADARGGFAADPAVHIVVEKIRVRTPEIAAAAGPKREAGEQQQGRRKIPDRNLPLQHFASSADVGGGPARCPLPVPRRLCCQSRARFERRAGSVQWPGRRREHQPRLSAAAAMARPSE